MFRKATKQDLEQITELYNDVHTEEEAGNTTIGWIRSIYPTRETVETAFQADDLFTEVDEGKIVAAARINQEQVDVYADVNWEYDVPEEKVMVLHTLAVSPKEKRKGYGAKFVKFYEEYALENGCNYLRMDTNERNKQARAMYKKLGYKEVGIVPCVFNGIEGVQLVCLEKRV
ncbi:MAG: GNAT family N-acetyltransferase [Dorea sp.]